MCRLLVLLIGSLLALDSVSQCIAVLSDIHVTPGSVREAHLREAVDEINGGEFDLVVVDGDLTNEGSDAELANVKSILDDIVHPLCLIPAKTGMLRWKWSNGTHNNMTGPGNVVPVVTADRVIIVAPDRYMTAIDRKSGQQVWRDNSYRYRESLGHSQDGTMVYAKTMDGQLVAVDATADGLSVVWMSDMGIGYDHAPCVVAEVDGVVYAGSRRVIVTALDAKDGTLVWQRRYGASEVNGIDIDPYDGAVWVSLIEGKIVRI